MLDIAESIFNAIAQILLKHNLSVREAFHIQGLVHVLEEFEGESNVELIAAEDFLGRIYQLGMP